LQAASVFRYIFFFREPNSHRKGWPEQILEHFELGQISLRVVRASWSSLRELRCSARASQFGHRLDLREIGTQFSDILLPAANTHTNTASQQEQQGLRDCVEKKKRERNQVTLRAYLFSCFWAEILLT